MFEDKNLKCVECGEEFVFSGSEQEFYAEKGFTNEPQRCKACRDARKNASGRGDGRAPREMFDAQPKEMFKAVCADCGKETEVPFHPSEDRPVYCYECFNKHKTR